MEITGGFGEGWEGIRTGGGIGGWYEMSLITAVQPLKATIGSGDR